jgi:ribonuclease VapC
LIVDTSALVAIAYNEEGADKLAAALLAEPGLLITPVIVEFRRVTAGHLNQPNPAADALLAELFAARIVVTPYDIADADASVAANALYGTGKGLAGPLNMLDLMVYGAAKVRGMPILCTGKDFTQTDAAIHPASPLK